MSFNVVAHSKNRNITIDFEKNRAVINLDDVKSIFSKYTENGRLSIVIMQITRNNIFYDYIANDLIEPIAKTLSKELFGLINDYKNNIHTHFDRDEVYDERYMQCVSIDLVKQEKNYFEF